MLSARLDGKVHFFFKSTVQRKAADGQSRCDGPVFVQFDSELNRAINCSPVSLLLPFFTLKSLVEKGIMKEFQKAFERSSFLGNSLRIRTNARPPRARSTLTCNVR